MIEGDPGWYSLFRGHRVVPMDFSRPHEEKHLQRGKGTEGALYFSLDRSSYELGSICPLHLPDAGYLT